MTCLLQGRGTENDDTEEPGYSRCLSVRISSSSVL
uniref:Uncharacterized protein n=1 Tax=Anguilla anguilla TaxID=7936 RepID=A0A0E9UXF3_ANGAN